MSHKRALIFFWICVFLTGCSDWDQPTAEDVNALKAKLEVSAIPDFVGQDAESLKAWKTTREIYADRQFRPAWTARSHVTPAFQQFLQFTGDQDHQSESKPRDFTNFDLRVTYELVGYASTLAFGRADPTDIDPNWRAARRNRDLKEIVEDAIESNSVAQLSERLEPVHPQYAELKRALQEYRAASFEEDTEERIRQIEINLDRWRWLPDDLGQPYIMVNIPSFELEVHDGQRVPVRMKVIVGSNENRTPIFSSAMKYIAFSPYWNIPDSIMTKETLPKIIKDPDYLARQNIEVIRVSGSRGEVVDPETIDWDNVRHSGIQLRQKPGARNSLGLVKFMFPNPFNVYLHDTPSDNLFDRLTRNLSHGCIRIERPEALASYVLRDQPQWTSEKIQAAMHARAERQVPLQESLPVHIVYFTAWVDSNGQVQFANDIYGYDARQLELMR